MLHVDVDTFFCQVPWHRVLLLLLPPCWAAWRPHDAHAGPAAPTMRTQGLQPLCALATHANSLATTAAHR